MPPPGSTTDNRSVLASLDGLENEWHWRGGPGQNDLARSVQEILGPGNRDTVLARAEYSANQIRAATIMLDQDFHVLSMAAARESKSAKKAAEREGSAMGYERMHPNERLVKIYGELSMSKDRQSRHESVSAAVGMWVRSVARKFKGDRFRRDGVMSE